MRSFYRPIYRACECSAALRSTKKENPALMGGGVTNSGSISKDPKETQWIEE